MKIRVKLPPGAAVDANRLVEAIRGSLQGEGSIWSLNPVPAVAQLEESLYAAGVEDITRAWQETAALLGVPAGESPSSVRLDLGKSLAAKVSSAFWRGE